MISQLFEEAPELSESLTTIGLELLNAPKKA